MSEHLVVSYVQEGDKAICRIASPSPGLVAICGECGGLLRDTDPNTIARCPTTMKYAPLRGLSEL